MEHPEKALFDEVRALKSQIEDIKERVFKLEASYKQQVEEVEERHLQNIRATNKLKDLDKSQDDLIFIQSNNVKYPLTKRLINDNCFFSKYLKSIFDSENKVIILDVEKEYVETLLSILRFGKNSNSLNMEDLSSSEMIYYVIKPDLKKEKCFHNFLRNFFDNKSFNLVADYLDLEYQIIPDNAYNLMDSYKIDGAVYTNDALVKHYAYDVKDISLENEKEGKAFFISTKASLIITLKEKIRTNTIYIKPFVSNKSIFSPTNGWGSCQVFTALENANFENQGNVPSYNDSKSKPIPFQFKNIITFNKIKFYSPSANFSISVLAFKEK